MKVFSNFAFASNAIGAGRILAAALRMFGLGAANRLAAFVPTRVQVEGLALPATLRKRGKEMRFPERRNLNCNAGTTVEPSLARQCLREMQNESRWERFAFFVVWAASLAILGISLVAH